jgi:hypothetical protein
MTAFITLATFLEGFLAVFFAAPDLVFGLVFDFLPLAFFAVDRADAGFADFLRVFLDIRLPFVAFSGSLTVIAAAYLPAPESGWRLGKSDVRRVW